MSYQPQFNSNTIGTRSRLTRKQTQKVGKQGNFVLHIPVAAQVLEGCKYKDGHEFTQITYTAVTQEPRPPEGASEHDYPHETDTFKNKYQLRQKAMGREIKVALVMTMYNEDDQLSRQCPFSWGPDGWKNFLVVIVSDGRQKINPRVLTVLEVMGLYVDKVHKTNIDSVPVEAHFYEFTTQVSVHKSQLERRAVPTQCVFVLKEKNAKKINSHKWFFNAVCGSVNPEVCMLLDVGTKPSDTSLFHLYRAFERDQKVGGACGEIKAELGFGWKNLLNPIVAAQNFEYKMSNILDKPLESVFGYISVLPGAFSAYRYRALLGRPLEQYFAGENPLADIFTSNLYLAEDRILCFELVTKKDEAYVLKYVKTANAETDVPDTLDELVSQRRRWLNGSFFCSVHALMHFTQIYRSPHSFYQKVLFTIEFFYNAINLVFTWFGVANFYLSFYFLFDVRKSRSDDEFIADDKNDPFAPFGDQVFETLNYIYMFLLFSMFVTALGNRPRGTRWLYKSMSVFFATIMALMLFMGGWSIRQSIVKYYSDKGNQQNFIDYVRKNPIFRDVAISVFSTYGLYLAASVMHLDPWHIFTSQIQYLFLLPTYLNVFMIYSFCNLHDVTWGTKGATKEEPVAAVKKTVQADGTAVFEYISVDESDINDHWVETKQRMDQEYSNPPQSSGKRSDSDKREDATKTFRTKIVLFWIFCNVGLIAIFTNGYTLSILFPNHAGEANPYLTFLFWSVAGLSFVRFLGSCVYMVGWWSEKMVDAGKSTMQSKV
ncbi:Chitin synthase, class 2 [Globomyces sp. JEL0801]|nr:Chitin synthase, class 2 [Globomyces sp. JEL0801]